MSWPFFLGKYKGIQSFLSMNYDDIMMGIEWLNGFSINRYFIDGILVGNGIYYMITQATNIINGE